MIVRRRAACLREPYQEKLGGIAQIVRVGMPTSHRWMFASRAETEGEGSSRIIDHIAPRCLKLITQRKETVAAFFMIDGAGKSRPVLGSCSRNIEETSSSPPKYWTWA